MTSLQNGVYNSSLDPRSYYTRERVLTFSISELSASAPALSRPMTVTVIMEIDWLLSAYLNVMTEIRNAGIKCQTHPIRT